jgi:hypothetical protein
MSLLAGIRVTRQVEEDESASFVCTNGFIWSSKTTIRSRPSCGADQSVPFGTDVVDTRTCSFSKIPFGLVPALSGTPELNSRLGEVANFFRSRSSCNACFVWKRSMILLTLRRLISTLTAGMAFAATTRSGDSLLPRRINDDSVPRATLTGVLSEHRPETGNKPTVESARGGRRLPQLQRGC